VPLFRFSVIRFNSHRIHYDRRYAMDVEGHPGLIVQGTMINFLMVEMARTGAVGKQLRALDFRIHKPIFDTAPFTVRGCDDRYGGNIVGVGRRRGAVHDGLCPICRLNSPLFRHTSPTGFQIRKNDHDGQADI
jgi:3-methylfumaryl-CoA hydratase